MSDVSLPRPGDVLGVYPEREDERVSTPDRIFANAVAWVRRKLALRYVEAPRFLRLVQRAEVEIAALQGQTAADHLLRLRRDLRLATALSPQLVARSFATVRVAAKERLGLHLHNVQLLGGLVMLRGQIAEMDTGEGKTLVATLPAATAALSGTPVHVITVNDFLARRDADWMSPVYAALGLTVGVIFEGMSADQRKAAYACDVVYGANKQVAFDYLKDRIALGAEMRPLHLRLQSLTSKAPRAKNLIMRGLCFAIVDEADSCMIDEARTPLIISRAGDLSGLEMTCEHAISLARQLEEPRDYVLTERDRRVRFTDIGKNRIRRLSERWGGVWAAEAHREELSRQAITSLHLYLKDKHYIVRDGVIAIVDEYTGRIMADRSWDRGLHQMIEVKEGLMVTGSQETVARISYQRFFRRYLHICGMTGTAREVSGELWSVYGRHVRRVPPNRRSRRRDFGTRVYLDEASKWQAVVRLTRRLHSKGRPVLIGTRSVAASETLSECLTAAGLHHALLNARQDQQESEIVARAGLRGAITVATNMAGRGTDVRLEQDVDDLGGLFVIGTEPHDARRIDRQLFGRCGRQGNRGGHVLIASLEDEILRAAFGQVPFRLGKFTPQWRGRLPGFLFRPFVRQAQIAAERRNAVVRRQLMRYDETMEDLLAFSGRTE